MFFSQIFVMHSMHLRLVLALLKVTFLNIGMKSLDLCRMVLHFFAKLSIFTAMELDFGRLPYKTSLEPEKHEKQGPEVRYRIYLDELDRF